MLKTVHATILSFLCVTLMPVMALASEAAHEAKHGGGGLPQFDPTSWPSQIFWLAVFFIVLYFVFGRSIIPTLSSTIEMRANYIDEHIQKAEVLSQEAEELQNKIHAALKEAGQSANANIVSAENTAKDKMTSALSDFRSKYEENIGATESKIQDAKTSAMKDMEQIATTLAAKAAEKLAGISPSESDAAHAVKSISEKARKAA